MIRHNNRNNTSKALILDFAAINAIWTLSVAFLLVLAGCAEPAQPTDPPSIEPDWVQPVESPAIDKPDVNLVPEVVIESQQPTTPPEPNLTTTDKPQVRQPTFDPPEPNETALPEPNTTPISTPNDPPIPEPNEPAITEPNESPPVAAVPDNNEPNIPDTNAITTVIEDTNNDARTFHDQFAPFFKEYVNESGFVNYDKLEHNRTELRQLLRKFAALEANEYNKWSNEDQFAMWINAWNLRMLEILAGNYPVESNRVDRVISWWPSTSIRHIDKRLGDKGIKGQKLVVMDEQFTLEKIEQQIFREKFADPRVFIGISQGCNDGPPLLNEPYYGHKLNEQLKSQIKKFITRKRVFHIDRENNIVRISAIFDPRMYGKDFIHKYNDEKKFQDQKPHISAALNFMLPCLTQQQREYLLGENYRVLFIKFDWRLNDIPKRKPKP